MLKVLSWVSLSFMFDCFKVLIEARGGCYCALGYFLLVDQVYIIELGSYSGLSDPQTSKTGEPTL